MQTFMPYSNFAQVASCLDMRRLGKQRVECKQIYLAITDRDYGWQNHPIVTMWRGYPAGLAAYGYYTCKDWISRGYKDTLLPWFVERIPDLNGITEVPPWVYNKNLQISHRSNLIRKDPIHYRKMWPDVPDDLPYVWIKGDTL